MSEPLVGANGLRVGGSVRHLRLEAKLTLRQLADAISVSVGTMSAIENDKVALTVTRLHQIADVLGVAAPRLMALAESEASVSVVDKAEDVAGGVAALRLDPVLAAAVEVFRSTGYHGATMRLIASSADISVAGIYHHYRSKQSLLVALVEIVMGDLSARVRAATTEKNPALRFAAMVEALALFHAARSDLAFIVSTETRSLEAPDRRGVLDARRRIQQLLDQAATEAVAGGQFRTTRPHRTARAIATMCMALPYWFSLDGPQTPQDIATEYATLALGMMGFTAEIQAG